MQRLILASGSPRRKEIMGLLGLEFLVQSSEFDESLVKEENPEDLVEELALQKALEVAKDYSDAVVVGGDTVVAVGGEILGKAKDVDEAREILNKLIGSEHEVVTGVAVVNTLTGGQLVGHEIARVKFRDVLEEELEEYLRAGYWQGFAGGYAIQGGAKSWVIERPAKLGTIIGMPVSLLVELLESVGIWVENEPEQVEAEMENRMVGITEEGLDRR